jgi:hypothetical protein
VVVVQMEVDCNLGLFGEHDGRILSGCRDELVEGEDPDGLDKCDCVDDLHCQLVVP